MSGRILVIDDVTTDRIVLKVRLTAARYAVDQAQSGEAGMRAARKATPGLILVAGTLGAAAAAAGVPALGAAELCAKMRAHPVIASVPIVAIGAARAAAARLALFRAGADEVLGRPLDEPLLMARIRSLLRARSETAELRLRGVTGRAFGLAEEAPAFEAPGRVALVCADPAAGGRLRRALAAAGLAAGSALPEEALDGAAPAPDVFVLDASGPHPGAGADALALLPELRAREGSRHAAVLVLAPPAAPGLAAMALDLGAGDAAPADADPEEIALRLRALIRWKRDGDRLRRTVRQGLRAALTDPLTGLYNRRYALPHLARTAAAAAEDGRSFAVMAIDLDRFKAVNDVHGHGAGDAVLVEVARRLRCNLRAPDLVARMGGEEFLVAMPGADLARASAAAERLCRMMREQPIEIPGGEAITVTMSIGLAMGGARRLGEAAGEAEAERLIAEADRALYAAKADGRAKVTIGHDAA